MAQSDIWIATKRQKLGREYQCTIVVRVTFELPGIIMQSCDLLVTGQPDLPRQLLSVHHSSEPKNECISLLQKHSLISQSIRTWKTGWSSASVSSSSATSAVHSSKSASMYLGQSGQRSVHLHDYVINTEHH